MSDGTSITSDAKSVVSDNTSIVSDDTSIVSDGLWNGSINRIHALWAAYRGSKVEGIEAARRRDSEVVYCFRRGKIIRIALLIASFDIREFCCISGEYIALSEALS